LSTINTWKRVEVNIGGVNYAFGDLVTPQTVTLGSDGVHIQRFEVATATTQKIFDVADDLADFDYLIVISTQDIEIEKVIDDGANVVVTVDPIYANLIYDLHGDGSRDSNHTEDWGADGTAATIDKLTISNASGSTANVLVAAFT